MTIKELFSLIINTPISEIVLYIGLFIGGIFLLGVLYYLLIIFFDGPDGTKRFMKFGKWFFIGLVSFTVITWVMVGVKYLLS